MAGVTGWWAETFSEPAPKVLALAGGVPSVAVTHGVYVFPSVAALTLTGSEPPVIGPPLRPGSPSLALTGGVPGILIGNVLTPGGAGVTVTGATPTVVQSNNNLLFPAAAARSLTGGTPTIITGPILIPTAATPAITGGVPVVTSSVVPVAIGTVGTPGSENTGDLTCSITPAGGEDVVVFAWVSGGSSSCYKAVYGGSSLPMRCLGRVKVNSGQLAAFVIRNVAGGSATVTVSKSGSDWAQAVALSYANALDFRQAKVAKGSGTSASQAAAPAVSARSIQSFTRGGIFGTFSSLSGGTNRINDSSGFVAGTVGDTGSSATFSATVSSSVNWGSVIVDAVPTVVSTPKINYTGGLWSEANGGTQTFTVTAAVGDYIVVDMAQSGNGDPSSVTLDGVAMTLVDTQTWSHPNTTSGFLKRYRSAQVASAGDKTVSITATGGQWWRAAGCSISNATSFGTPTKTSATSSAPSQAVTCSAGQLILQSFATAAAPTDLSATNHFDSPSGSAVFLLMNAAEETTTFSAPNSTNWGAMATVIS
ncbi:Bacteriophage protein [Mycobacteroides abscessus subsp. abscessus]|nr:hypothetical protein [Mycobacteroides abscessus subsp. abscessus]QSM01768.1 minor tail protein [Mycobacterium phage prophiGD11-1]SIG75055.1 Bacteriophage protein [Mycobacteroides abscessus subsp. abscessus]